MTLQRSLLCSLAVLISLPSPAPASVLGLRGAVDVAVSPDGAHVYVLGKGDDAVSEWARDPATGALAYLGRQLGENQSTANPPGTVPDVDRPEAIAISPDGKHVYIATSNTDPNQMPPTHTSVAVFARDSASGELSYLQSILDGDGGASLQKPTGVAVSPDGASVYVTDFRVNTSEGAIDAFSRDPGTGFLTLRQVISHDPALVDGLDRAHFVTVSGDGKSVYVTCHGTLGNDAAVGAYVRDPQTGMLSFVGALQHGVGGVTGLADPYHARVSPDGAFLYVASHTRASPDIEGSIDVFPRDPASGALSAGRSILESDIGVVSPDDLRLSPDGSRLYASAQGTIGTYDGKLVAFSRDTASGALAVVDLLADDLDGVDGLKGALALDLSPDGQTIYVASEQDAPPLSTPIVKGAVGVFGRAASPPLSFVEVHFAPEPTPGAASVAALAALAALAQSPSESQSRGRRKTS